MFFILTAGHSGDAVLKQSFQKPDWFHNVGLEDHYVLYLDCRKNGKQDWWWGAKHNDLRGKYKDTYTPAEKRLLTTIEWVIEKYGIDRNRVYLSGVSMGGSGSLGIGLCRGDIFAAVNVTVPAGVDHVKARLFDQKVPDPPVLINFSSYKDSWSNPTIPQPKLSPGAVYEKMKPMQFLLMHPLTNNGRASIKNTIAVTVR